MRPLCDGCACLEFETAKNPYDVFTAMCCDKDKPVTGARRVVAVSTFGKPFAVARPAWCLGKKRKEGRA